MPAFGVPSFVGELHNICEKVVATVAEWVDPEGKVRKPEADAVDNFSRSSARTVDEPVIFEDTLDVKDAQTKIAAFQNPSGVQKEVNLLCAQNENK